MWANAEDTARSSSAKKRSLDTAKWENDASTGGERSATQSTVDLRSTKHFVRGTATGASEG